jgi:predicted amidohydrolase YtcJ
VSDRWAAEAAEAAAARGVVGIVDFELPDALPGWQRRFANGFPDLRVISSVWPERLDVAIERGLQTGAVLPDSRGLLTMGPLKVVTDGSLNTRTAYCHDVYPGTDGHGVLSVPPERLVDLLQRAKSHGLQAAVHAIGDWANALALDAFETVQITGSIEHAQLVDVGDFERMARLGLIASVQPEHLVDDRDVADRHWAGRTDRAFAYRSLLDAGVTLALGSDAPVAPLDPWLAVAAAVYRSKDQRAAWHAEQAIPLESALLASAHGRSGVQDGPDDLVVLDADPLTADRDSLRAMPVAGTMVGSRWSYRNF